MKGVTKAMGQMNRQMILPSLQKIMQEFERQNEKMEQKMNAYVVKDKGITYITERKNLG